MVYTIGPTGYEVSLRCFQQDNLEHTDDKQPLSLLVKELSLKWMCHEIFYLYFLLFEPIWSSNKEVKIISNSVTILLRYSNFYGNSTLHIVNDTAEPKRQHFSKPDFSSFMFDYLGKIETEFENILACFVRGPDRFESWKSRDKLPLKSLKYFQESANMV